MNQSTNSVTTDIAVHKNFDLSQYNTMALSCTAKQAYILDDESQVADMFDYLSADDTLLILSGGSNVILPAKLSAQVVLPRYTGLTILTQNDKSVEIEVMTGNNWHELVVECTQKGWFGLENLALIPGLVGASPVQNIGAYGVQLEDCLTYVKAFHIPSKTWQVLSKEDCQFAYRDSLFKQNPNTWLISRVGFRLHKDVTKFCADYGDVQTKACELAHASMLSCDRLTDSTLADNPATDSDTRKIADITPVDVMNAIIEIRKSKLPDPAILANTGSFFQNPIITRSQYDTLIQQFVDMPKYDIDETLVKIPAGWLIDKAGLKGRGIAPILTHAKQALVLTNHDPFIATQQDIANTRDLIINTVQDKYGVELHAEPVWISN